jgi:hypothetical protein
MMTDFDYYEVLSQFDGSHNQRGSSSKSMNLGTKKEETSREREYDGSSR